MPREHTAQLLITAQATLWRDVLDSLVGFLEGPACRVGIMGHFAVVAVLLKLCSARKPYRGGDTTSFARGEGAWFDAGRQTVFFTTTTGSRVWAFNTETNVMAMVYDAADGGPLREPDNVTVHAPSGQVFVAEDSDDLQLVLLSEQSDEWIASPFCSSRATTRPRSPGRRSVPTAQGSISALSGDEVTSRSLVNTMRSPLGDELGELSWNAPGVKRLTERASTSTTDRQSGRCRRRGRRDDARPTTSSEIQNFPIHQLEP